MDGDPVIEEAMEGDTVEESESDITYVGRVFNNENEAYDAYNSYALAKGF